VLVIALAGCGPTQDVAQAAAAVAPTLAPVATPPPTVPAGIPREALVYRAQIVRDVHFYWGLGERVAMFFSQLHQESRFKADAQSRAGALGLGQFMPGTAAGAQAMFPADLKELCRDKGGCPLEAAWAIRALVLWDRRLWEARAFATGDERLAFMLADFNGGPGHITKERRLCATATTPTYRVSEGSAFGVAEFMPSAFLRIAEFLAGRRRGHRISESSFSVGLDDSATHPDLRGAGMSSAEEVVVRPKSAMQAIVLAVTDRLQIVRSEVLPVSVDMMNENGPRQRDPQIFHRNQPMHISRAAVNGNGRVPVQREDSLHWRHIQPQKQRSVGFRVVADDHAWQCNPNRYFEHVQAMCGAAGRADWACRENTMYAAVILHKLRPLYERWLPGV
jgi:hypothetical protein